MRPSFLLEIIIPTFKRPETAVKSALSALNQISTEELERDVHVVVCDDCTPGLREQFFRDSFQCHNDNVTIIHNRLNKGMSQNIYDLVCQSSSTFCTILTDDDWINPNVVADIIKEIRACMMNESSSQNPSDIVGIISVPRYSYLESGQLHCIECCPYPSDKLVSPNNLNVLRLCRNAFILTGLIFRPSLIDFSLWDHNIQNAFFPLLYYASIASKANVLFLKREWFHHTCDNVCHWESWGNTEIKRFMRLHADYLKALALIRYSYPPVNNLAEKSRYFLEYKRAIVQQLYLFPGSKTAQFVAIWRLFLYSPRILTSYFFFVGKLLFLKIRFLCRSVYLL